MTFTIYLINTSAINPFSSIGTLVTLIDFTLSNARRFYSAMGNPLDMKELKLSQNVR